MDLIDKHPATLFGMALAGSPSIGSSKVKVTSMKVKSISKEKLEIALITCKGDLCEMKDTSYEFNPPLQSTTLDSNRLEQIRNKVLRPKVSWLITDPLALLILITCSALAYGTLIMGADGMMESIAKAPRLENGVGTIFGSTRNFAFAVSAAFWFSIIAHGIEAGIALRYCLMSLQLGVLPTILWMTLVFLVGFPIFSRIQALVEVQEQYSSKSK